MPDAPTADERKIVAQNLGPSAAPEDIELACSIVTHMQQHQQQRTKVHLLYTIDGNHATYFDVKISGLRVFTSEDCDRLRGLTDRIIDISVRVTGRGRGHVSVAVRRFGPKFQGLSGGAFGPYEAPRQRKRRLIDIDWAAGRVTDRDDQRRIAAVIDDVYNYQDRMPDVSFFFDHVSALRETDIGGGGGDNDDGSTSEQAAGRAREGCGYALCFADMPDIRFAAFLEWLRARHALLSLVYMTFPPSGTEASGATPMFIVHMQRTVPASETAVLRTPRQILTVPKRTKKTLGQ